jgi:hypothetical protein
MTKFRAWLLAGTALTVALCGFAALRMKANWPFTQGAVTSLLQQRFGRDVRVGSFRQTWFPPGCVADDVRFLHRVRKDLPPLIVAQQVAIRTTWPGILRHHIDKVTISGLRVTVPPADASGKSPVVPNENGESKISSVSEVEADNAKLMFLPRAPGEAPTIAQIHQLKLDHISGTTPISFRVSLQYSKPAGELTASGTLGPWKKNNPGATPIAGQYRFTDADLRVFKGLSGVLATAGKFNGSLSRISLDGSADVPQFHIDGGARKFHLIANYQASVDTKTADTQLNRVEAHAGRTIIVATGKITGRKDEPRKTASVDLKVETERVEDLLNYFSEERQASMTGAVRLHAHAELPPGSGFLKRIILTGWFNVTGARFTNPQRQDPVNRLSESAAGEKKKDQDEDGRTVFANLKGEVVARNGLATLSNLSFDFAGSAAEMNGSFNLLSKQIDIRGILRTEGKLSDTATGFRSVLLKVATPFLSKQKMTVVPFKIEGTASRPAIGLDLHGHH